jgi:hypothetical protein
MFVQTPNVKQTAGEKISAGLHIFTIAMFGLFSLVATLHVATLLA